MIMSAPRSALVCVFVCQVQVKQWLVLGPLWMRKLSAGRAFSAGHGQFSANLRGSRTVSWGHTQVETCLELFLFIVDLTELFMLSSANTSPASIPSWDCQMFIFHSVQCNARPPEEQEILTSGWQNLFYVFILDAAEIPVRSTLLWLDRTLIFFYFHCKPMSIRWGKRSSWNLLSFRSWVLASRQ